MTRVLWLVSLVACSDKDAGPTFINYDIGTATACMDIGDTPRVGSETESVNFTGTVYQDAEGTLEGNLHPCGDVSRVLTMIGDDGSIYELGYGVHDEAGSDITPALDIEPGDDIYLHFVSVESFGSASGFVVQDSESIVAALDVGTWGSTLEPAYIPGLSVSTGEIVGGGNNDCGATRATEVVFSGDADRAVAPVDNALITVSGGALKAYAISSWEYTEVDCTDVAGELIWGVFR